MAEQPIAAGAAEQVIVAVAAEQPVVPVVAAQLVVAPTATQPIMPGTTVQPVVTAAAMEAIAANVPNQPVVGTAAELPIRFEPGPSTVPSHRSSPKRVTRPPLEALPGTRRSCRGTANNRS
jgi:hypothetical protein